MSNTLFGILESMQRKKLERNTADGMIAGVGSGLSDYVGLDPALWRLAFIFATVMTAGAFLVVYIAAWFLIPKRVIQTTDEPVIYDV
jgi:phage shock protein C